jgi:hypothetical protein
MGFKLNLSSNNEVTVDLDFTIYADGEAVFVNLESEKPMKAIFKKVNGFLLSDKALETKFDEEGQVQNHLNKVKYIKEVFVRFEDAFEINVDEEGSRPVTFDDVVKHAEFTELLGVLFSEASKIVTARKNKKAANTKKS